MTARIVASRLASVTGTSPRRACRYKRGGFNRLAGKGRTVLELILAEGKESHCDYKLLLSKAILKGPVSSLHLGLHGNVKGAHGVRVLAHEAHVHAFQTWEILGIDFIERCPRLRAPRHRRLSRGTACAPLARSRMSL